MIEDTPGLLARLRRDCKALGITPLMLHRLGGIPRATAYELLTNPDHNPRESTLNKAQAVVERVRKKRK